MSIPIYSLKAEEKKFLRAEFVNTPDATKSPGTAREYDMGITDSLKYIYLRTRGTGTSLMGVYLQMIDPKLQNLNSC
jgi:hypothetical protein